jgi:hypothetical protein
VESGASEASLQAVRAMAADEAAVGLEERVARGVAAAGAAAAAAAEAVKEMELTLPWSQDVTEQRQAVRLMR